LRAARIARYPAARCARCRARCRCALPRCSLPRSLPRCSLPRSLPRCSLPLRVAALLAAALAAALLAAALAGLACLTSRARYPITNTGGFVDRCFRWLSRCALACACLRLPACCLAPTARWRIDCAR